MVRLDQSTKVDFKQCSKFNLCNQICEINNDCDEKDEDEDGFRTWSVHEAYRRGKTHCLQPRSIYCDLTPNPLDCCCGRITDARLASQLAWCNDLRTISDRCGGATLDVLEDAGEWWRAEGD